MINTDKMLTYESGEMKNTLLTGDYEDLYLLPGENKLRHQKNLKLWFPQIGGAYDTDI